MKSDLSLTDRITHNALDHIAQANHCQAGAVIALSGALAVALARATANGSLDDGASGEAAAAAMHVRRAMDDACNQFRRLADQDAEAITAFVELRRRGEVLKGYELLCDGPRDMADLAIRSAHDMQGYRVHVCERTKDDLEFAITQMCSVARAAMQLLDSNLRIWPLLELVAKYDPHVTRLIGEINHLQPVVRIRSGT